MIRKFDTAYFMISVDSLEDNKAFALKEQADFPMLANPDKKVASDYGVIAPDAPPERQFARRWTFYIDPTGKIAKIEPHRAESAREEIAWSFEAGARRRPPQPEAQRPEPHQSPAPSPRPYLGADAARGD